MDWHGDGLWLTTDAARVDLELVHGFLRDSYWARGVTRDVVERSIAGSIPFSLFAGPRQIGFARVISDRATFAYLADVFVVEAERGRGRARWMMERIVAHPELEGLRRWMLVTRDAQRLYAGVGFTPITRPERFMERMRSTP
jgi:GNAT superfamily N-acetyltransferase